MPNWCMNSLLVTGKKKDLVSFRDKVKPTKGSETSGQIDLNKLSKRPKAEEDNWYDWNVKHWGTKWNIEAHLDWDEPDGEVLEYQFESAWAPPCDAFLTGSKKFKNLKFRLKYEEPGMCFMGSFKCKNGKILQDDHIEY